MKQMLTGLVTVAIAMFLMMATANAQQMVFGSYAAYSFRQMSPEQIDWSGVNCVIHFATPPKPDGTLNFNAFQMQPARIEQMVLVAHENQACVLLTVGGANTRWAFVQALAPELRAGFIANIVAAVEGYGYDGVTIDWEPIDEHAQPRRAPSARPDRAVRPARGVRRLRCGAAA